MTLLELAMTLPMQLPPGMTRMLVTLLTPPREMTRMLVTLTPPMLTPETTLTPGMTRMPPLLMQLTPPLRRIAQSKSQLNLSRNL